MKRFLLAALVVVMATPCLAQAIPNGPPMSGTPIFAGGTITSPLILGNQFLAAGTMVETNKGEVRTVVHRYDWTNAMIVALGAVTAGDIAACTLPAKTVVTNAYVIITGPDTSVNALGRYSRGNLHRLHCG